jgi:group I intron endonuclease
MKFKFYTNANSGGIYRIVNEQNGRIYVGSTVRFKLRAYSHKNNLENNRHTNTFLQNDWNKCGSDAFVFEVLLVVDGDQTQRLLEEQKFIDSHYDNQKLCYNLNNKAIVTRFNCKNKDNYNPETDGRAGPKSQEWTDKMSAKMTELYKDPERLKQASDFSKKRWEGHSANITVTNKNTGESVLIDKPLKTWCKERNIDYRAFHLMVRGKTKSSSGWFLGHTEPVYTSQKGQIRKPLSKEHRAKIAGSKYKGTAFVLPCGKEVVIGESVKDFCREHNLSYSTTTKYLKLIASST